MMAEEADTVVEVGTVMAAEAIDMMAEVAGTIMAGTAIEGRIAMTGIDESARDRKNALSSLMLSPATNIQFTRCSSSTKDGLANVGVGSMEDISELGTTSAAEWYEGIDNLAQLAGVTVSVISISGDENFRLENIGRVADLTAGHVDKIDPLKVAKNFAGILQNPVVATNVRATMLVHSGLRIVHNENDAAGEVVPLPGVPAPENGKAEAVDEPTNVDKVMRDVGNVTAETQVSIFATCYDTALVFHRRFDPGYGRRRLASQDVASGDSRPRTLPAESRPRTLPAESRPRTLPAETSRSKFPTISAWMSPHAVDVVVLIKSILSIEKKK
eukprot:770673_1